NDTTDIQGQAQARDLNVLARKTLLAGPVNALLTPARFGLDADLRAPDDAPPLFAHARLETHLTLDRRRGRFTLDRAQITGDAIAIDARGWVQSGDGEFSGDWRLIQLGALFSGLRGEAGGQWRAMTRPKGQDRQWNAAVNGDGANVSGVPEIVPQLL